MFAIKKLKPYSNYHFYDLYDNSTFLCLGDIIDSRIQTSEEHRLVYSTTPRQSMLSHCNKLFTKISLFSYGQDIHMK